MLSMRYVEKTTTMARLSIGLVYISLEHILNTNCLATTIYMGSSVPAHMHTATIIEQHRPSLRARCPTDFTSIRTTV
uniref:Uncharacterized protein n=1 Tax=Pararge aegeria TaxID=116150 RepID=S4NX84_9NEOP